MRAQGATVSPSEEGPPLARVGTHSLKGPWSVSSSMPERIPKAQVEFDDLTVHEGAPVLLRRALAKLAAGELLEGCGDSPELAQACCVVPQRGPSLSGRRPGTEYLPYRTRRWTCPLIASVTDIAEVADPQWGLAPRGARIEAGGPKFAFTLRQKRDVWAQELTSIYKQAAGNQWSAARDIPWDNPPKLAEEVEAAVCQIMTFLTENEFAALYVPARLPSRESTLTTARL